MGIKILAVDDSKVMRFMLSNVLSCAGHSVALACDGKEGATMAADNIYDLVITDINMPEINGIEFARILRNDQDYNKSPIIFLTTEACDNFEEQCAEIDSAAWIIKPFSPRELLEIVARVIAEKIDPGTAQ